MAAIFERGTEKMQINGLDNNQLNSFLDALLSSKSDPSQTANSGQADATLRTDYTELVNLALRIYGDDDTVVQDTAELLASGALDSPEIAQTTAENILKFGI